MYLLVVYVACLCLWLVYRWAKLRRYWAERGVPHEPPHVLLGSLTRLMRENMGMIWMRGLYERFNSRYVGIWSFWQPVLVVNCPQLAKRILLTDADNFRNRFGRANQRDHFSSRSVFLLPDPEWSHIRRRLSPAFTAVKTRGLHELVTTKTQDLIKRMNYYIKGNEIVSMHEVFSDYATDIISSACFGPGENITLTGKGDIRDVTRVLNRPSLYNGLSWLSIYFVPLLANILDLRIFPKSAAETMKRVFSAAVEKRGGYDADMEQYSDILASLIRLKQKAAKEGVNIEEVTLAAQAGVLLQAGFHTSAITIAYASYELAFAPQVQDKLYEELMGANTGTEEHPAVDVSQLTYLHCVSKEVFRKYPSLGWMDRVALRDYRVDDQLVLEAGTPVFVNATGMQYDPKYYPDPEGFHPERFLPENQDKLTPFTFLSFGEGPRKCIASLLGYHINKSAVAALVLNYKIRPLPGSPKPAQLGFDKTTAIIQPAKHLQVDFVPRRPLIC